MSIHTSIELKYINCMVTAGILWLKTQTDRSRNVILGDQHKNREQADSEIQALEFVIKVFSQAQTPQRFSTSRFSNPIINMLQN